eukprot:COSAG05_NODE_912_length_6631_cov_192.387171_6_plen_163_part_00
MKQASWGDGGFTVRELAQLTLVRLHIGGPLSVETGAELILANVTLNGTVTGAARDRMHTPTACVACVSQRRNLALTRSATCIVYRCAVSGEVTNTIAKGMKLTPPGFLWPTWDSRAIHNPAGKRFVLVLLPPYPLLPACPWTPRDTSPDLALCMTANSQPPV